MPGVATVVLSLLLCLKAGWGCAPGPAGGGGGPVDPPKRGMFADERPRNTKTEKPSEESQTPVPEPRTGRPAPTPRPGGFPDRSQLPLEGPPAPTSDDVAGADSVRPIDPFVGPPAPLEGGATDEISADSTPFVFEGPPDPSAAPGDSAEVAAASLTDAWLESYVIPQQVDGATYLDTPSELFYRTRPYELWSYDRGPIPSRDPLLYRVTERAWSRQTVIQGNFLDADQRFKIDSLGFRPFQPTSPTLKGEPTTRSPWNPR